MGIGSYHDYHKEAKKPQRYVYSSLTLAVIRPHPQCPLTISKSPSSHLLSVPIRDVEKTLFIHRQSSATYT